METSSALSSLLSNQYKTSSQINLLYEIKTMEKIEIYNHVIKTWVRNTLRMCCFDEITVIFNLF